MNRDDIIQMAREAGFFHTGTEPQYFSCRTTSIERFAALVAEAEAERISNQSRHIIKRAEARGAEAEREACAALCLETEPFYGQMFAEAIRARGNT
jgi:adenylyl- and sulfurtransferase ThiI